MRVHKLKGVLRFHEPLQHGPGALDILVRADEPLTGIIATAERIAFTRVCPDAQSPRERRVLGFLCWNPGAVLHTQLTGNKEGDRLFAPRATPSPARATPGRGACSASRASRSYPSGMPLYSSLPVVRRRPQQSPPK